MTGMTTIISIYVSQIIDGFWPWDRVPPIIYPQVAELYTQITGEEPNFKR